MKSKLRMAGFAAFALAGLSWLAETAFYGDLDPTGVLKESLFLPLTFLLSILGIILLVTSVIIRKAESK